MAEVLFNNLGIAQVSAVDVGTILEAVEARLVFLDLVLQQTCVGYVAHASVQLDPPQPLFDGGDLQLAVGDHRFLVFREDSPPFCDLLLNREVSLPFFI